MERNSTHKGAEILRSSCTFTDIHDPVFKLLGLTACAVDLVVHPERFHTIQTCEDSYGVTKMVSTFEIERHSTHKSAKILRSSYKFPNIHDPVLKLLRLTTCAVDLVAHSERFHTIQTGEDLYGVT